jgi:hypothetical protein
VGVGPRNAWSTGLHDWQHTWNDAVCARVRLVPTRVDQQYFAHAPVSAVSNGNQHSAAVTAVGALYTWGKGEAEGTGSQVPDDTGGCSGRCWGGARMGRCHGLRAELALAFAMGTHERLGAGSAAAGGGAGRRQSLRTQGKAPAGREEEGCPYLMMPADLVKRVVEACGWRAEGELGEGVLRLMGGRRTSGEM